MDFAEAWTSISVGTKIRVKNNLPPPSKVGGPAHNAWKSHNHKGTLEQKITQGGWRYLRVQLETNDLPPNTTYASYDIAEGAGHIFELAEE